MSAFFDTNILVYAQQMDGKGDQARALLAGGGKLSVQVLNEFTAVSRRKQRRDWREIDRSRRRRAHAWSIAAGTVTLDLHHAARALAQDHRLSFYDALIVVARSRRGCDTLFSEDMQHGRSIGGLAIVNPFLDGAP